MKVSAVILTKNEEEDIVDCLNDLKFCDEIIVIDDYSDDKTPELVKNFENGRIRVFQRHLDDDFSAQRNFALQKCSNDYVLFVDADERVPSKLREEIGLTGPEFDGYFIKRTDFIWGRMLYHGEVGNIFLLRFANKNKGKWEGKVHEVWKIQGKVRKLREELYHFPHQSVSVFLTEINKYTDLRSKELYERGVKASFLSILMYTKAKFILNYILRRGFLDGTPGFLMSAFMSFHSFLVRGKLWLLWKKD